MLKTLSVHFICIFLFAFLYYYFSHHFEKPQEKYKKHKHFKVIDCFLFSVTIQSGVGMTDISPISVLGKLLVIIQQIIMLSINLITLL
jgi:hypothetical protein